MKISGVYKITNTVTNDCYVGSSKDVKRRWAAHKRPSEWKKQPNNPLYQDMKKYSVEKFDFQVIAEVEEPSLKETEQWFIEKLQPTYNNYNAKGLDVERKKEWQKEYEKTDKRKEYKKEYEKSDKYKEYQKEYMKEYEKTDKRKKTHRKASNKYQNQLCDYNGQTITLNALSLRFRRAGVEHPTLEAKKYLLDKDL